MKAGGILIKKAEKICLLLILIFGIVVVLGIVYMLLKQPESASEGSTSPETSIPTNETLTEARWYYPDNIIIDRPFSVNNFTTADGDNWSLDKNSDEIVIFTYWASWCKYCKIQLDALKNMANEMDNLNLKIVLVNKLDNDKETIEQAENYLKENNIPFENVYDNNLVAYNELGVHIVPTTFVVDHNGILRYCYAGIIEDFGQLSSVSSYVREGRIASTEKFLVEEMMNDEFGVFTGYEASGKNSPAGHDVLSESQGIILEYAYNTSNKILFDSVYSYAENYLQTNGLFAWYSSDNGKGNSNALLDDLRILNALIRMNGTTKEYDDKINALASSIAEYNISDGNPVDFYTFDFEQKADRFTLCYGDLAALKNLEKLIPSVYGIVDTTYNIINGGYINDNFPFYKNYFDYNIESYDDGSLNMAEALYTVYHLSQVNMLKESTISWIKEQMNGDGIWARYDIHGNVASGYEYQSPAIYALVGLIALEISDETLLTQAISRMESFRAFNINSIFNGAFAETPSKSASYDQCLALLLYSKLLAE